MASAGPWVRRPRVSIFTPSHRTRYLDDCMRSLLAQTYEDWEWIVVLNQAHAGVRPLRILDCVRRPG